MRKQSCLFVSLAAPDPGFLRGIKLVRRAGVQVAMTLYRRAAPWWT